MPRKQYRGGGSGLFDEAPVGGPDYLPVTTDLMGNQQPSGLDMLRSGQAAQAARLQRMEMESKQQISDAARLSYFRSKGLIAEDPRIQAIREKAQFDAANFEKRYTAKQKVEIANLNMVDTEIDRNDNFSEEEKLAAHRGIQLKKLGISPSDLPKLSPYPKGRGPGDVWDEPDIGKVTLDRNGTVHVLQGWDKSASAQAIKDQHQTNTDTQKWRLELLKEKDVVEDGVDKAGNPKYRRRTPEEVNTILMDSGLIPRPPESDAEGRARVDAMRSDAGMPAADQLKPNKPMPPSPFDTPEIQKFLSVPVVRTDADFEALAPGAEFVDAKGKKYRKPERK